MSGTVLPHYFTCSDSPLCCMMSCWHNSSTYAHNTHSLPGKIWPGDFSHLWLHFPYCVSTLGYERTGEEQGSLSPFKAFCWELSIQPDAETQKSPNSQFFQDFQEIPLSCCQANGKMFFLGQTFHWVFEVQVFCQLFSNLADCHWHKEHFFYILAEHLNVLSFETWHSLPPCTANLGKKSLKNMWNSLQMSKKSQKGILV